MRNLFFIVLLLSIELSMQAQSKVIVHGGFLKDSVSLGQPISYYLTVRYPSHLTILFPDSTYTFKPFEFHAKRYLPTVTRQTSYDSVVYSLTSYEIDSLQMLSLPVFVTSAKDCVAVYSKVDTVFFKARIAPIPDSVLAKLPLKENTQYHRVKNQFNTVMAGIIGGVLIIVLIVLWFIFQKKIVGYFNARKLIRQHQKFLTNFELSVRVWQQKSIPTDAEHALYIWKQYMETLMTTPFTKYTSKEIRAITKDSNLHQSLNQIDGIIYGKMNFDSNPFVELKAFGEDHYYSTLENIRHGNR